MKRVISRELIREWAEGLGRAEATARVLDCLKCGPSKAEKIVAGRYPSEPSPLERKALAKLLGVEESTLFVPVGAGAKNRAS